MTVSPYLGGDSLEPFLEVARHCQTGVFVLVKTSNPGGGMFQDLLVAGGESGTAESGSGESGIAEPLYRHVARAVERWAHETATPGAAMVAFGAVVGATYPEQLAELRAAMPHAWLLVPG